MENRPKITVNVGLTVPQPQPGNEGTGLTHTPNTPEILAMMAENMASAEVEGPSRAGGNCGVVGSSGPFVFRPQAPAAASITSIAADLSRSSDQLSLPTISIADMDDIKREVSISPVSSVSSSLTTLSTMTPVSQQQLPDPPTLAQQSFGPPGGLPQIPQAPSIPTFESNSYHHLQQANPIHSFNSLNNQTLPSSTELKPPIQQSIENITKQIIKEGIKLKVKERISSGIGTKNTGRPKKQQPSTEVGAVAPRSRTKSMPTPSASSTPPPPPLKRVKRESEPSGSVDGDELRRHRRRERNKIAATKCRNKKKERHTYLIQEGEHLTVQNTRLKDEIAKLQADKDDLMSILRSHQPNCSRPGLTGGQSHHHNHHQRTSIESADPAASTAFYPQSAYTGNSAASVSPSVIPAASASPSAPNAGTQTPLPAYNAPCGPISEMCSDQPPLKMESFEGFDFMTSYYESGCNNHSVNPDGMQLSNSVSTQPLHHNQSGNTIPGGHFLGVRMIGMSYLDLDSRCIGLC